MAAYEVVIGLEVHVQLATASKLFCSCPTTFGQPANTNVCEVCAGMPGPCPCPTARQCTTLPWWACHQLHGAPAFRFRPEKLFLSGFARRLSDFAV